MDIFVVHWHEAELEVRTSELLKLGFKVRGHWSQHGKADFKTPLPEALVLSLDRLPSHSRAIAEWFWEAKTRRQTPIYFVGGSPDKVATTREKFPDAVFCEWSDLADMFTK